ncbi:MAG: hypothetical protein JSS00_08580 [Proteobacteria bacterium]|nr:hypothetical protein [Pseudomonadota bacterium]
MTAAWTYVVWCLMALVLVGTGLARAERRRATASGAPGLLTSALIWTGVLLFVVVAYRALSFWTGVGGLFR